MSDYLRGGEYLMPARIHADRAARELQIEWQDGHRCVYPISYLRTMCPCASCKVVRQGSGSAAGASATPAPGAAAEQPKKKLSLTILPGNFSAPLAAVSAELVGNYALRIEWSDQHASGIYSFQYLREICPQ